VNEQGADERAVSKRTESLVFRITSTEPRGEVLDRPIHFLVVATKKRHWGLTQGAQTKFSRGSGIFFPERPNERWLNHGWATPCRSMLARGGGAASELPTCSRGDRQCYFPGTVVAPSSDPPAPLIVPTLYAPPYRLRPFEMTDLDLVREASGDPYIPLITSVPAVFSEAEGVAFIERHWSRARLGQGCLLVIADATTDRGVGTIGLRNVDEGRASIGYWVVKSARGRGAAAHALRAVAAWALGDLRIPRLELTVEPWNTASIMTAERCGFRREGLLRAWMRIGTERPDVFMYSRLAGDPPHPTQN
jgi:RimJ/RimL family protein N-acetyltransferase